MSVSRTGTKVAQAQSDRGVLVEVKRIPGAADVLLLESHDGNSAGSSCFNGLCIELFSGINDAPQQFRCYAAAGNAWHNFINLVVASWNGLFFTGL